MSEPLNCVNTHNKVNVVNSIGFVTPCCDHLPPHRAIKLSNIQNFNEVLTHPTSEQLRNDLNAGVKVKECSVCWNLEAAGLKSRRMFANEDTNYKSTVLEELEIALDFTCNMMCRMCGPYHSSKWSVATEVVKQLNQLDIQSKDKAVNFNIIPGVYQDNLYRVLNNSDLTNLKTINIVGGEPFYSKNFEPLIDKLAAEVNLDNLDFTISTNASIFPSDNIIEKLLKMKKLNIRLSIDAVGDLASVIRYGVDWKIVEENIIKWKDLKQRHSIKIDLKIHCTISLLNINALQDLTDFCDLHGIHFSAVALKFPEHLSIYQLPLSIRQKWNVIDTGSKSRYRFVNQILKGDMEEKNRLSKFLSTCSILDDYQGNSFKDVNPEIYQLAEELKL